MDALSRAFYELRFQVVFMESKENQFQDLFSSIMEKAHPRDFQRVRPWGPTGDRKNDGYLRSERTLFQVYAPNEMRATSAVAKIQEDFMGALPHWEEFFERWVFVHNSKSGLGPGVLQTLLELQQSHQTIQIEHWGFEELRQKIFELTLPDLSALLGPVPSQTDMRVLGFAELKPVLVRIGNQPESEEPDLRPVPVTKLMDNGLSPSVQSLIKIGMRRANLVGDFFQQWTRDPVLGDRVATAFHKKYEELKAEFFDPDDVFLELQKFAGGDRLAAPREQAAVLAVLAYLFERCEIFERFREEVEA